MTTEDPSDTQKALDNVFAEHGVHVRPLRTALALLGAGWLTVDELVRRSALPLRTAQGLLAALETELEHQGSHIRLRADTSVRYRSADDDPTSDPAEDVRSTHPELLARIAQWIAEVPSPLAALDHVQATAETVLRRAVWLDRHYDLDAARLVLLGDHDLTSLAVHALRPHARITVVDIDDRVLAYLDHLTNRSIHLVHADLRLDLPPSVHGAADLVFSDPPYTAEGVTTFAARARAALADPTKGRVLLAYGYSTRHPALGHAVQAGLLGVGLTFEAIIPDFHSYRGAQAIGSAADLYVCQPTARPATAASAPNHGGIYTHGPDASEATRTPAHTLAAFAELASADGELVHRSANWHRPHTTLARATIAIDLATDPGPGLARVLLATNAARVAVLVPNAHPDLADAKAQAELSDLLRARYRLRLLRSTPDNTHAVVIANAFTPAELTPSLRGVHAVATKAHGKVGNTCREALILAADGALTKNAARQRVHAWAADIAGERLIDLPRHRIAELFTDLEHSVPGPLKA